MVTRALRRLKQEDCYKLEANLSFIVCFRLVWVQSENSPKKGVDGDDLPQ